MYQKGTVVQLQNHTDSSHRFFLGALHTRENRRLGVLSGRLEAPNKQHCAAVPCYGTAHLSNEYTRVLRFAGTISANTGLLQAGAAQLFSSPHSTMTTPYMATVLGSPLCGSTCRHQEAWVQNGCPLPHVKALSCHLSLLLGSQAKMHHT